jgi:gamma-glutamylcyclotransferase
MRRWGICSTIVQTNKLFTILLGGRYEMFYFAYAVNMSKKRMAQIAPESKPKFSVVLPNYRIIFTGYNREWKGGTATIQPFKGQRVHGAVYDITEADLKKLDRQEDYPMTYNRFKVTVWTENDEAVEAIAYIKKEQSSESKPSPEYFALISQGFKDWDID